MYIVTGGAGFIGSAIVAKLNAEGRTDILIVDHLSTGSKWLNLRNLRFDNYVHKDSFIELLASGAYDGKVEAIIHMGACSSTTERDVDYLMRNNNDYSRVLFEFAQRYKARFIYASSAATYGDGAQGYDDNEAAIDTLRPLNAYGYSKQIFDQWLVRERLHTEACGLKFFNVYGPNEYHKGDQQSVIVKAYNQILTSGAVNLYKSYRPDFKDGEQKRDFVYVKDCAEIVWWLLQNRNANGIFNVGTGYARSWNDLARAVFAALGKEPVINYTDMPQQIRDHYQYFTEARMEKLKKAGCPVRLTSLEEGVRDYVQNYLKTGAHL